MTSNSYEPKIIWTQKTWKWQQIQVYDSGYFEEHQNIFTSEFARTWYGCSKQNIDITQLEEFFPAKFHNIRRIQCLRFQILPAVWATKLPVKPNENAPDVKFMFTGQNQGSPILPIRISQLIGRDFKLKLCPNSIVKRRLSRFKKALWSWGDFSHVCLPNLKLHQSLSYWHISYT